MEEAAQGDEATISRVQVDGLSEIDECGVEVAQVGMGDGAIRVGHCERGVEFDGAGGVREGLVYPADRELSDRAVNERAGQLGVGTRSCVI
jgi:hypothetical protein